MNKRSKPLASRPVLSSASSLQSRPCWYQRRRGLDARRGLVTESFFVAVPPTGLDVLRQLPGRGGGEFAATSDRFDSQPSDEIIDLFGRNTVSGHGNLDRVFIRGCLGPVGS